MKRLIVALFSTVLLVSPALAAVTFDASSTPVEATATSVTVSHTVGTGSNRLIVACVSVNGADVTGVTYNGVALTLKARQTQGTIYRTEIWYLVAPATGTNNLVASIAPSNQNLIASGKSFFGVNQSNPLGTNETAGAESGTSVTDTVTSTGMVTDCLTTNASASAHAVTGGGGQTEAIIRQGTGGNIDHASSIEIASGSVTSGWGWTTSSRNGYVITPINAATSGGSSPIIFSWLLSFFLPQEAIACFYDCF
jgi:hypothetical protein